jgi:hypothetical protein
MQNDGFISAVRDWNDPTGQSLVIRARMREHLENQFPVAQLEAWKLLNNEEGARIIQKFLSGDDRPIIVTDWPDDIKYFCQAIITGPGMMINIPRLSFEMVRVDAYPSVLEKYGAVQHNAYWDAMALRVLFN